MTKPFLYEFTKQVSELTNISGVSDIKCHTQKKKKKNDQAGSLATPEEGSDSLATTWAGPWTKQLSLCEANGQGQQAHLGLLYLLAECTHMIR